MVIRFLDCALGKCLFCGIGGVLHPSFSAFGFRLGMRLAYCRFLLRHFLLLILQPLSQRLHGKCKWYECSMRPVIPVILDWTTYP